MINIKHKENCCGCTACENICGRHAIKMEADEFGFKYPKINRTVCVDCEKCEAVCPIVNPLKKDDAYSQLYYGGRLISQELLIQSQSGGISKKIADTIISLGGIAYGVIFDESLRVVHVRACNQRDSDKFRKSKYVQSDLSGIFQELAQDLKKDKRVVFFGTSCQVAGLLSYCSSRKIRLHNLITIDVICHGVQSPLYWRDYISYITKKYNKEIVAYDFRDKENGGWSNARSSVTFINGEKIYPKRNFYHPILFRPSCYYCKFASFDRVSDITIGDFWGIEKLGLTPYCDNKGVSLILVNSEKGNQIFELIKGDLTIFKTDKINCVQPQLIGPCIRPKDKDRWDNLYLKKGFKKACKELGIILIPSRFELIIKSLKRKIKYFCNTYEKNRDINIPLGF